MLIVPHLIFGGLEAGLPHQAQGMHQAHTAVQGGSSGWLPRWQ